MEKSLKFIRLETYIKNRLRELDVLESEFNQENKDKFPIEILARKVELHRVYNEILKLGI